MLQIKPRDGMLYITGMHNQEKVRKSTGLRVGHEKEAQEKLREFIEENGQRVKVGPYVRDAAKAYLKSQNPGTTSAAYVRVFSREFGARRVGNVDTMKVHEKYINQNKAEDTIRRELGAVQAMLNWASRANNLGIEFSIPKPRGGEERLRFLEVDEVKAMIDASPLYFKPFVVGLFYTGMRRSELAGLIGRDIVKGAFVVGTRKGKSGKIRYRNVPIHDEVEKVIPDNPASNEPLFVNEYGEPWTKDITRVNKVWSTVAKRAGVDDCQPHDARRTFASRLLEQDVDLRTIAELLGHTDLTMLMRYAQVRGERKVDVLKTLSF